MRFFHEVHKINTAFGDCHPPSVCLLFEVTKHNNINMSIAFGIGRDYNILIIIGYGL